MDTLSFSPSEEASLRKLGISAVVLFGSQARGHAQSGSDYDIGVLGKVHESAVHDSLYDMLEPKIGSLVNIDIVFLDKAPLELAMHVVRYGSVLFETKRGVFAGFKEMTIDRYADFAPIREQFQMYTFGRIPS